MADLDVSIPYVPIVRAAAGLVVSIDDKGRVRKRALPDKDKDETTVSRFSQWSRTDTGSFTPVGNTQEEIEPGYYDYGFNNGVLFFTPVRPRTDDLVLFPDSASKQVLQAIVDFWNKQEIFDRYGLPFKRGVLLYGPPGSGKSCTLQLVARDVVDRDGIVINMGNASEFVFAYRALRDIQPETPVVVLMEDFEVLLGRSESKVLNLLDGVEQLHKVVFLATTNFPEQLGDRVINRPSRFDVRIRIGHPSESMRRQYLRSLVHPDDHIDIERYVRDAKGLSLAHLKELFVATHILGTDYEESVKRLKKMREKPTQFDRENDWDPDWLEGENNGNYM